MPEGLIPTHGGDAVAVYLGVITESEAADGIPAALQEAMSSAEAMGYFAGYADLACDQGAREGLGLAEGFYYGASVLFATVADANLFAAAFPGDVVGIVEISTYCLD